MNNVVTRRLTLWKAGGKCSFAFPQVSLSVEHTLIQTNGLRLNSAGPSSLLGSAVKGGAGGRKWVARENNIYSYLSVN